MSPTHRYRRFPSVPIRQAWRRAVAVLASVGLVLGLAVASGLGSGVANAAGATVPVSNPTLSGPTHAPLQVGDTVTLTGTWGPINHPQSGDSFTVGLPSVFEANFADNHTFGLMAGAISYGTCTITNTSTLMTCVLNGNHTAETGVNGTFGLQLKATRTTNATSVDFQVNGGPIPVALPGGGGITDGSSLEKDFTKTGELGSNKRSVKWTITVGGDHIAGMSTVDINDSLTSTGTTMKLCMPLDVTVKPEGRESGKTVNVAVKAGTETTTSPVFTLTKPSGMFDSNTKYVITYTTCTDGNVLDPVNSTYTNNASFIDKGGATQSVGPITVTQDWNPTEPTKSGKVLDGAARYQKITWTVDIPGSRIKGTDAVTLADTLGTGQELCEAASPYGLGVEVKERYGPSSTGEKTITTSANLGYVKTTTTAFTITLNDGGTGYTYKDYPYIYRVTYTTCVTGGRIPNLGTVFNNTVQVNALADVTGTATVTNPTVTKTGTINDAAKTIDGQAYPANTTISWDVTIPGEKVETVTPTLTLTDTPGGSPVTQAICTPKGLSGTSSADLKTRLGLTVTATDQVKNGIGYPDVDLLAATAVSVGVGGVVTFAITPPAPHFSRDYQYKLSYTMCTASGGLDSAGTEYKNTLAGNGLSVSGSVKLSADAWGTGGGVTPVDSGSFALTKNVAGDAAARVSTADFTVNVREISPAGSAVTYTLTVKDGGTIKGLHALGTGWTVELTEPTLPTATGVWRDPVFAPGSNVTISNGGKKATVTPRPGGANVALTLTNTIVKSFAVGDYVWIDTNEDGLQGNPVDEPPLDGVTVELVKSDGSAATDVHGKPVATTTTNALGLYMFDELPAGDYRVKFTLTPAQAAKYQFTVRDAQSNSKDATDSDADGSGWTVTFTLDSNNSALDKVYTPQSVKATEGIDPTWDAGVHVKHPVPPVVTTPSTTSPTPTVTTTPTSPVTTKTTAPSTTPTIPTVTPTSGTGATTPPPPTNVPAITTSVPEPNQCVDLVEHGFVPGETVTITITGPDGQYTITAVADENGDVAFCLKSAVPVRVTIEVLGENHVVVREVALGIGGELPNTGVPTATYLTWALLLLGAGAALVLVGRRGRKGKHITQ